MLQCQGDHTKLDIGSYSFVVSVFIVVLILIHKRTKEKCLTISILYALVLDQLCA